MKLAPPGAGRSPGRSELRRDRDERLARPPLGVALDLEGDRGQIHAEALEWATTRGSRSGRVAWQFIQDLAGRLGKSLAK